MAFHFCPQCGTKLQPDFKFCPTCGEKLPCPEASGPIASTLPSTTLVYKGTTSSPACEPKAVTASLTTSIVSSRPPLHKTRNSLRLDNLSIKDASSSVTFPGNVSFDDANEVGKNMTQATPPKTRSVTIKTDNQGAALESSPLAKSPRNVRGKAKRKAEEIAGEAEVLKVPLSSPIKSPHLKSPLKGKGKSKKTKAISALEPLHEGTEVMDTNGKKWKLVRLLSQATTELIYEVSPPNAKESNYIVKLGAKDGKIFNELNFLQRAAKPASIERWVKQHKMDFIGLPQCIGFGLHADSYRFLVFPNMGHSLLSLMNKQNRSLSEVTVLQLACRILDVLLYIHSNEYVHADINAENVYINQGQGSQVYLVGYNHAFRYCPGGHHVEYREGSRTPNEGAVESISLDSHNGAAPSRRSDLQSLGYCMLYWHTGTLPWTTLSQPDRIAAEKRRYINDVPGLLYHCFEKKKVSDAFQSFLSAVMALEYSEQPDYTALKSGLSAALNQLEFREVRVGQMQFQHECICLAGLYCCIVINNTNCFNSHNLLWC
ncbi:inactive serine/threonine-protein kinase VRK3 isoform X2 [Boleophthalmus pectinirostris]|uniref:inactive serine/threonine-protein kinase VRK3 isoform X2 n=1 Tax=Boleophthalmus pectinirostris TaxID=150288 RepID=UPI00242FD883|nr:inactive serine/threonine-protein kinase VRK3 isoform X2 [Boleophthalmus pectinirostris]